ncbi:MAG: DUF4131 domain-containing protein [Anaerolineae bacterium]|nr:DUF4131 domain-containing protein [Anaerolineae bacterium]
MPLLWLSLAFLLGLLLGDGLPGAPAWLWLVFAALSVPLVIIESRWGSPLPSLARWRAFTRLPAAALLLAVLIGAGRYRLAHLPPNQHDLAWYNDRGALTLTGVIANDPAPNHLQPRLTIRVDQLVSEAGASQAVRGRLQVTLPPGDWRYGDRLQLTGIPRTPSENADFSYRDYLERHGISSIMYRPQIRVLARGRGNWLMAGLYALRRRGYEVIQAGLPLPEAALLSGILLGVESDIPQELNRAYQVTGTAHIIAISGFNMSILAGLIALLVGRWVRVRWRAFLVTIGAIALYTLLVGANPPVVRAAVMSGMSLFGAQIGRRGVGLNTLAFNAAAMSLISPDLPWDIGFQLSFCATLGLVLFAEPAQDAIHAWLERRSASPAIRALAGGFNEYLLLTLAAQVAVLPVLAYHFRRVSLISVIANPLVLPPQPLILILGGAAMLLGIIWLPLGRVGLALVWALLAYSNRVVEALARVPVAEVPVGSFAPLLVIACFAALLLASPVTRKLFAIRLRVSPMVILTAGALMVLLLWRAALARPDGMLTVTVLNQPGGTAVLARTPGGEMLLLDAGESANALGDALSQRAPPLGARIDWLLVSRVESGRLYALASLVERYPIGGALIPAEALESSAGERLEDALYQRRTPLIPLSGTGRCVGNDELRACLQPAGDATVFTLNYGEFHLLVPGEAPPAALLTVGGRSIVLLDGVENLADWLATQPQALVLPERSEACPACLDLSAYRWITFRTDGQRLWVSGE